MALFNCSNKKKARSELKFMRAAYENLLFCADFSEEVEKFDCSESFKEQLKSLYKTNLEILEDSELHTRFREYLTETEKAELDEILSLPRPTLDLTD